jgi:biotin carboxyl carrier protein
VRNFHLTINGKRYAVSVERDPGSNDLEITVDGQTHRVGVEEEEKAAPSASPAPRPSAARTPSPKAVSVGGKILAPLPGVVLSVAVAPGDSARAGDTLLVLEAMKMENVIQADSDCVVQAVHVAKGDKVEASQLLMEVS